MLVVVMMVVVVIVVVIVVIVVVLVVVVVVELLLLLVVVVVVVVVDYKECSLIVGFEFLRSSTTLIFSGVFLIIIFGAMTKMMIRLITI